ncbi:MEDS domain-containing protein [Streptacidiphilus sp. PAMC 29251]
MRVARNVVTLDPVGVGDHVCWLVDPGEDFMGAARAFAADGALFGDKVMVVGAPDPRWSPDGVAQGLLVDPVADRGRGVDWDAGAVLGAVRREVDTADREGFRALRVLARMDRLWPDGASPEQVARHELGLDALVAGSGAIVVCAYHQQNFSPTALAQVTGVHPQRTGREGQEGPAPSGFRMFSVGPNCWSVSGVVDAEGAAAFRTAVSTLLADPVGLDSVGLEPVGLEPVGLDPTAAVRLHCEHLELMDTAGLRALAEAARTAPGRRVLVEQANDTVRRCWDLLGYGAPQSAVEFVR